MYFNKFKENKSHKNKLLYVCQGKLFYFKFIKL